LRTCFLMAVLARWAFASSTWSRSAGSAMRRNISVVERWADLRYQLGLAM